MRIRLEFCNPVNEAEHCINIILGKLIIDAIDELILRTPDYWVQGRRKMSLTVADLSPKELQKITPILMKELKGGYLTKYSAFESKKEKNNRHFEYTQPGYVEGEKDKISRKGGYGLDMAGIIQDIVGVTINVVSDTIDTDGEESPLTVKAIILQDRLEKIASELEKEPKRGRGRSRASEGPQIAEHIPIAEHLSLKTASDNRIKPTVRRRRSKSLR